METSFQLFTVVEDGDLFVPLNSIHQNLSTGKFMLYDQFEDTDDGTFPRVSDYTRLANKIENYGASAFIHWQTGRKLKADTGYCTVIREGKSDSEATLVFDKPIKVSFGEINGEHIVRNVTEIKGEFDYDWFWRKNGRQEKIANGCEIYFNCKEFKNESIK